MELDAAVDSGLVVTRTWTKDGSPLSPDCSRLTLTEPRKVQESPQVYQTNVSFNTLEFRAGDSGIYVCSVTMEPQDTTYIDGTTADINRDIAVEGEVEQCNVLFIYCFELSSPLPLDMCISLVYNLSSSVSITAH